MLIPGCTIPQENEDGDLILATTTSMQDSGLLGVIIPKFNDKYDVEVKVVAVGTGAALRLGENGDADILIVHAPEKIKSTRLLTNLVNLFESFCKFVKICGEQLSWL